MILPTMVWSLQNNSLGELQGSKEIIVTKRISLGLNIVVYCQHSCVQMFSNNRKCLIKLFDVSIVVCWQLYLLHILKNLKGLPFYVLCSFIIINLMSLCYTYHELTAFYAWVLLILCWVVSKTSCHMSMELECRAKIWSLKRTLP